MADDLRSTLIGAPHLNEMVVFGVRRFTETYRRNIRNANQSGYLPFTQPPKSKEQRDYLLSQQASQQALQMMLNPESDAAERAQGVELLRDIQEARRDERSTRQKEANDEGEQSGTR